MVCRPHEKTTGRVTIIGGPPRRLRLVTFVHVPFSPPLLLILVFQPILVHTIVTEGQLYAVFCGRVFCVHRVGIMFLFCWLSLL